MQKVTFEIEEVLTVKQREVLAARVEGLSIRQIARTLEISEATVTARWKRAKMVLDSLGVDVKKLEKLSKERKINKCRQV